jgi:tRNA threonylcarbamoyladenosine biosynthesis protein TsaB
MKKLFKQLIIDTATKYIFLSLVIDGVEKQHFYEVGINNHSVTIIPYLQKMLENEKIKLQEIDEIIVGVGPGSYTGVRIGVTVAKMIAYLNNLSLYKVSSLALMASSSNKPYVLAFIDARRGNAFMGLYANSDKKLIMVKDDCLQNIEKFKTSLEIDFEVVEEGKPDVNKILKSNILIKVDDLHSLTPNYLQVTEAERNLRNEN